MFISLGVVSEDGVFERERETDRQTDRQRQRDRQTDREGCAVKRTNQRDHLKAKSGLNWTLTTDRKPTCPKIQH